MIGMLCYIEFGFFDEFFFFRMLKVCDFCSMVLGSYAHFMWEAEDDDEEEEEDLMVGASPAMMVSAV